MALKNHLHWLLIGLRRCGSDIVSSYTRSWVVGNDEVLLRAIVLSYYYVEWGSLQEHEWGMLCDLVHKGLQQLDRDILSLIPTFVPCRLDLAISFLKETAARGDVATLRRVADVLAQPNATNDGWNIEIGSKQDYLDIFQNFERLPELDHAAEQCLDRLGQIEPMLVIDFLELRIAHAVQHGLEYRLYQAVPIQLTYPLESVRSSATYRDVLQRVCE